MIQFVQPFFLLLILAIPFFYLFYGLYRRIQRKKIADFGAPQLMEKLMPLRSRAKGWVKITLFSLAWLFLMVGLARPQIGARLKENTRKGAEIMIALDVSNSMLAQDYSPNRLERAKLAISRLVDKLHGDRIGLIVFAGESFVQLPITTDYVSAKIFLNTINTRSVPVQGTAMGDAITTAVKAFSNETTQRKNDKAIIIITDGENHEDDPVSAAKEAADLGIKVFTIGVGSPDGKPIPVAGGELMKDRNGNIVVTRLNERILTEVAAAGEGAYIRAGNEEFGLNPIIDKIKDLDTSRFSSVVFEDYDEQFMYFLGIAVFFLVLEFLVGSRRVGKRLFAVIAILVVSGYQMSAQTDKKEIRVGNRMFDKRNYKEAEVNYRKALIKDSTSVPANYNLGNTLFRMGDFAGAEAAYGKMADSLARVRIPFDIKRPSNKVERSFVKENSYAADYFYNLGNASLSQKKYQEAVNAYKNALRRNPSDMDAKTNLAYAQKKLEDQQKNDKNQNKDQDKNQKDKNKDQNKDKNNDRNKGDNDKNKDQNKDNNKNNQNNGNGQTPPPKITPQATEQMLQAMQDKENQTQEKVKRAKAMKSRQKEKNW